MTLRGTFLPTVSRPAIVHKHNENTTDLQSTIIDFDIGLALAPMTAASRNGYTYAELITARVRDAPHTSRSPEEVDIKLALPVYGDTLELDD